ncbi:MAG: hypothetical protein KF880_09565 [Ferruginibacter sp.]|nr:hypothetical protein [Ferruginibacter sp.]
MNGQCKGKRSNPWGKIQAERQAYKRGTPATAGMYPFQGYGMLPVQGTNSIA